MTARRSILLKSGVLALVLAVDVATWPALLAEMGAVPFLRVLAAFALLAAALGCAALVRNRLVRLLYAAVLGAGALVVLGFTFSSGSRATYFDFVTTVDARASFADALTLHWPAMLVACIVAALLMVAVAMKPPAMARRFGHVVAFVPLLAGAALIALLVARNGQARGIPSMWQGVGFAGLYAVDSSQGLTGEREAVSLAWRGDARVRDIILIVDESVSGNYLDLNAKGGAYSGLSKPRPGWQITDFGIAASMTNCSMPTNVGLRFGAGREDYQRKIARSPSIWAYAKRAGMKTVYLYGQHGGLNENYMTDGERAEIDDQVYFADTPLVQRDQKIAEKLAAYLNNDTPEFILASKAGAHFPLTGMYPSGHGPFAPEAEISGLSKDAEFWKLYRNNYRNAVEWSVGAFFDRLFELTETQPAGMTAPALILYTSDHGQTFYENAQAGSVTHCRTDAVMEEGAVPLVLIEQSEQAEGTIAEAPAERHDASSHYQMFPTLLLAMGYNEAEVAQDYGPSLASEAADPMSFAVQRHLRLGVEPKWIRIDSETAFRPSDLPSAPTEIE